MFSYCYFTLFDLHCAEFGTQRLFSHSSAEVKVLFNFYGDFYLLYFLLSKVVYQRFFVKVNSYHLLFFKVAAGFSQVLRNFEVTLYITIIDKW